MHKISRQEHARMSSTDALALAHEYCVWFVPELRCVNFRAQYFRCNTEIPAKVVEILYGLYDMDSDALLQVDDGYVYVSQFLVREIMEQLKRDAA